MTWTRPCRRMIRHFSHILLTLGRTFTTGLSLVSIRDTASGEVVGGELYLHLVAGEDADVVHPHLAGDVSQHLVPVLQLDAEHRVRQRLDDRALEHDRVFLRLRQKLLLRSLTRTDDPDQWMRTAGLRTDRLSMLSDQFRNTTRVRHSATSLW